MTRSPRPFYPAQTATGETYVVDGRSGQIVRTIVGSFDTTVRWQQAKRISDRMNSDHVRAVYATRQRATLGCLTLLVVLFVIELATGDLSRLANAVINLAL